MQGLRSRLACPSTLGKVARQAEPGGPGGQGWAADEIAHGLPGGATQATQQVLSSLSVGSVSALCTVSYRPPAQGPHWVKGTDRRRTGPRPFHPVHHLHASATSRYCSFSTQPGQPASYLSPSSLDLPVPVPVGPSPVASSHLILFSVPFPAIAPAPTITILLDQNPLLCQPRLSPPVVHSRSAPVPLPFLQLINWIDSILSAPTAC